MEWPGRSPLQTDVKHRAKRAFPGSCHSVTAPNAYPGPLTQWGMMGQLWE